MKMVVLRATVWLFVLGLAMPAVAPAAVPAYEEITEQEIAAISFEDVEVDDGFVLPVAPDLKHLDEADRKRLDEWVSRLEKWNPGRDPDLGQRVRYLMSVAALGDLLRSEFEGEIAHVIFERLRKQVPKAKLVKAAAWVVLRPGEGRVVLSVPALDLEGEVDEDSVRERASLYAKKLLGRLLGKLPVN
jgi:hypothetical protein